MCVCVCVCVCVCTCTVCEQVCVPTLYIHVYACVYKDQNLVYFPHSTRSGKALKVFWGKEENVGFFDRWNPFSTKVPYTIFASHLMLRKGRVDNDQLRISKVVPELERAINDLRRGQQQQQQQQQDEASASSSSVVEDYHVKEEDVVVSSYLGMSALVHNDSNLGFFKRRGLMNW